MKKNAFTLAEVLITLAIVGVVAAVSLPTLNTNVQKQGLSSQIAKFYNQYTKAIEMYKVDNELDELPNSFDADAFVRRYFKVTQKCERQGNSGNPTAECFADSYRAINGNASYLGSDIYSTVGTAYMLADGAVMSLRNDGRVVTFDVNGRKGPNINGYDLQTFTVYDDGSIDDVSPATRMNNPEQVRTQVQQNFQSCLRSADEYGGCFGHLLRNGFRFDY